MKWHIWVFVTSARSYTASSTAFAAARHAGELRALLLLPKSDDQLPRSARVTGMPQLTVPPAAHLPTVVRPRLCFISPVHS